MESCRYRKSGQIRAYQTQGPPGCARAARNIRAVEGAAGCAETGLVEERLHRFHEVLGDTLVHFFADFQPFD